MPREAKDLLEISITEKLSWFREQIWDGELSVQGREALKRVFETTLEQEQCMVLGIKERYERTPQRRGHCNGYYERTLDTTMGPVRLRVPRVRGLDQPYQPAVFSRYQRRMREVDEAIAGMFLCGVSTRAVGRILKALCGVEASPSTVSRTCKDLDKLVRQYHCRRLQDCYVHLFFDAVSMQHQGAKGPVRKLVLVAYGITQQGVREVIDFRVAHSESEKAWSDFLWDLQQRGLLGEKAQTVTVDGGAGLLAAVRQFFPRAKVQRCWVHKLRNVAAKLPRRIQDACLKQAKKIYLAPTYRQARAAFVAWCERWQEVAPQAVRCLARDIDELLTYYCLPPERHSLVRTTNPLERIFVEVRRRTRPISCFVNQDSLERILLAVFFYFNHRWANKPIRHFTHNT